MTTTVQAVGIATTTVSPASITDTIAASTAGTLLWCVIAAIGASTPTISTPAGGWIQVQTGGGSTSRCSVFMIVSNAGGITTVTSNLTNANSAAMMVIEIAGVPQSRITHLQTVAGAGSGSSFGSVQGVPSQSMYLERWLLAMAHDTAQAFTATPGNAYVQVGGSQVSTNGTTNIELRVYIADISSLSWAQPAGALAGAVANGSALTRLSGDQSVSGGVMNGMAVTSGYCGAGGAGPG